MKISRARRVKRDCADTQTSGEQRIDAIMGFLKSKPGGPSMFEDLFAEPERERQLENEQPSGYARPDS